MRSAGRAGFTILHLTILLAVMTALACLAIPSWFSRSEVTLDNAVHLLARDLRDAQDRAAFQHRKLHVQFHASGDGYSILDVHDKPIEAPVGSGPFVRRYSGDAVFRGVHIESISAGPDHAIHFGPRGLALNEAQMVLVFRGERCRVEVEKTTGNLSINGAPYRTNARY